MSENFHAQIYNNLNSKETDDLLEIWKNGNTNEWDELVFEIIQEILVERLGFLPSQSIEIQVSKIIRKVEEYKEKGELNKALSECEHAIQLKPDSAIAYNYRGEIFDELGQLEDAITNYQKALQLDHELKVGWTNLLGVEAVLEEEFEQSISKQHLDLALDYAYNDEPEKALEECEKAKLSMPSIARAYNYLGLIMQTLEQLEPAIDSYRKAIELNPEFYAARENLVNARKGWEEEQYHTYSNLDPLDTQDTPDILDAAPFPKTDDLLPQWLYMDEKTFLLNGWPGRRTRQGRGGFDPIETYAEQGHMQGVIVRLLLTRKFRTRNPIYIFIMACVGLLYFLCGALPVALGGWNGIIVGILGLPQLIVGAFLLVNVVLSLRLEKSGEDEENGFVFF